MSHNRRSNLRPTEDQVQAALAVEKRKWRIFRLQQVRAQAHELSAERRRAVQAAEAEEVAMLRQQLEQVCAQQQQQKVQQLQDELQHAMSSIGQAHRAAQEQLVTAAAEAAQREELQLRARERGQRALREERKSRQALERRNEEQHQHRRAVQIRERVRAHRVAQQPTPVALQREQQSLEPPAPPPVLVQEAGSLITSQYRPARHTVTRIAADPDELNARVCAERERLREAEERQLEQLQREEAEHRALERGRRAAERERLRELQERLERDLTPHRVDAFLRAADASDFSQSDESGAVGGLNSHSSLDGRPVSAPPWNGTQLEAGVSGVESETSHDGISGMASDSSRAGISGMASDTSHAGISGMVTDTSRAGISGMVTDTSRAGISALAPYASRHHSSRSSYHHAADIRFDSTEGRLPGLDISSSDDLADENFAVAEEDLLSCESSKLQQQVAELLRMQQLAHSSISSSSSSSNSPAPPASEGAAQPPPSSAGDDSPPFDAAAALRQADQLLATVRRTRQQRRDLLSRAAMDSSSDGTSWHTAETSDDSTGRVRTPELAGTANDVEDETPTGGRRKVGASSPLNRLHEQTDVLGERITDATDNRMFGRYSSDREREEYENAPTAPVDGLQDLVGSTGNKENIHQHRQSRFERNKASDFGGDSVAEDTSSFDEEVRVRVMFQNHTESDQDSPSPLPLGPVSSNLPSQAARIGKKSTDSLEFIREMKSYLGMDHDTSTDYLSPPSATPPVQIPQHIYANLRLLKLNRETIQKRLANGGRQPNARGLTSQDRAHRQPDSPSTSGGIDSDNLSKTSSSDTHAPNPITSSLPGVDEQSSMYSNTPVRIYREDVKQDGTGRRPLRKRDKFELQKKIVLQNYVKRLLNTKQSELALTSQSSVEGSAIEFSSMRLLGALTGNESVASSTEVGMIVDDRTSGHVGSRTEQHHFGNHVGDNVGDVHSIESQLNESELDRVPSRLSDIQESSDERRTRAGRPDGSADSTDIGSRSDVRVKLQQGLESSSNRPVVSITSHGRVAAVSLHGDLEGSASVHSCGVQVPSSCEQRDREDSDAIKATTKSPQSLPSVDGARRHRQGHNSQSELIAEEQQGRHSAPASRIEVHVPTAGTGNNFRRSPGVSSSSAHCFLNSNSSISIPSFPSTSTPTVYNPPVLPPPGSVSSTVSPIVSCDDEQRFHSHSTAPGSAGLRMYEKNVQPQGTTESCPAAAFEQDSKEQMKPEASKTKLNENSLVDSESVSDSTSVMPHSVEVSSETNERSQGTESPAMESYWSTTATNLHQYTDLSKTTTEASTTSSSALLSSATETSDGDYSPGTVVQKQRDIYNRLLELNTIKQQFLQYLQQQERLHEEERQDPGYDQSTSRPPQADERQQRLVSTSGAIRDQSLGEIHQQQQIIEREQMQRLHHLEHLKSFRGLQHQRPRSPPADDSEAHGRDLNDKPSQDTMQKTESRRNHPSSCTHGDENYGPTLQAASALDSASNEWSTTDESVTPQATQRGTCEQRPSSPILEINITQDSVEPIVRPRNITQPSSPATITTTRAGVIPQFIQGEPLHSTPVQLGLLDQPPQPLAGRGPDVSLPNYETAPRFNTSTPLTPGHVTQLVPELTETSQFPDHSVREQPSKLVEQSRSGDVRQADVSCSGHSFQNTSRQSTTANDSLRRLIEIVDLSKISDLSRALRRSEFFDSRDDSSYTDDSRLNTAQGVLDTPVDGKGSSVSNEARRSSMTENQSSVSLPESSSQSLESLRERQSPPSSREGSTTLSSGGDETQEQRRNARRHLQHKLNRIEDHITSGSSELALTKRDSERAFPKATHSRYVGAIAFRGHDACSSHDVVGGPSIQVSEPSTAYREAGKGVKPQYLSDASHSRVSEAETAVFRSSETDAVVASEVLSGRSNSSSSSCDFDEVLRKFGWARGMLTKMDKLEEDFPSTDSSTV